MKILVFKGNIHRKNLEFIQLAKKIQFHIIENVIDLEKIEDLKSYDAIISIMHPINISKYPYMKFIFGPQFSVNPKKHLLDPIKGNNSIYNLLSRWVTDTWSDYQECIDLNIKMLPFGVNTDRFCEIQNIQERTEVILYFKRRAPSELSMVRDLLDKQGIIYKLFSYVDGYNENDYLTTLQNAKFCFVLDAHESQGFALQEAMSCNVPLVVWDVTSMSQEHGMNYGNVPATSVPYWDKQCGEKFTKSEEMAIVFEQFISNIENYHPRDYILKHLSVDVCENRFIEAIDEIPITN